MKILLNLLSVASLTIAGTSSVLIRDNSNIYKTEVSPFYHGSIYKLTDEGKIDTSVGEGNGILEDKTFQGPVSSITEFANGNITATTNLNDRSIYKLTNEGKIDRTVGDGTGIVDKSTSEIVAVTQLSNGLILAGTIDHSIYKLNDDGTVNDIIESNFDGSVATITQLSDGTILAGTATTGGSIYKLNSDGTINSIVADKITNHGIVSIVQLDNGTILASVADMFGEIYKLNSDGTFNSIVENGTFDLWVHQIFQLSNGTILAGTEAHSIYKLTDEGKIDTSVGNGTGKLEDGTFDSGIRSFTQLSNGTILAGTNWHFN